MTQYFSVTTSGIIKQISLLKKSSLTAHDVAELQNPDQKLISLPSLPKISLPALNLSPSGSDHRQAAPQPRLRPDATAEEIMADARSRRLAENRENQWLGIKYRVSQWFSNLLPASEDKPVTIAPAKGKKEEFIFSLDKAKSEADGLADDLTSDRSKKPPPK